MTDRHFKQDLLRRLQLFKEHLKQVDNSNPTTRSSGRGVKLIEDVIKYISEDKL